ncbi:MAG: hypothetical protein OEY96_11040 [Gammaproteobacteria bacterium]|nr:hypothetical protein [Gammaproteobacteria bacterium]
MNTICIPTQEHEERENKKDRDYSAHPEPHHFVAVVMLPTFKIVPDNFVEPTEYSQIWLSNRHKKTPQSEVFLCLAERQGFEPWMGY